MAKCVLDWSINFLLASSLICVAYLWSLVPGVLWWMNATIYLLIYFGRYQMNRSIDSNLVWSMGKTSTSYFYFLGNWVWKWYDCMTRQLLLKSLFSTKIHAKRFQNHSTDHFFIIYCGRLSMSVADRLRDMRAIIIWMHSSATAKRVLEYLWLEEPKLVYMLSWVEFNIFAAMWGRMPHLSV